MTAGPAVAPPVPPTSTARTPRRIAALTVVLGVLGGLGGTWIGSEAFRSSLCEASWSRHLPAREVACFDEALKIASLEGAGLVIDNWLADSGGPTPVQGLQELTSETAASLGEARQRDEWAGVFYAERLRLQRKPEFNSFEVSYRLYRAPNGHGDDQDAPQGTLWDEHRAFSVRLQNQKWLISDLGSPSRYASQRIQYPFEVLAVNTKTYDKPTRSSEVRAPDARAGRGFRLLCQAKTHSSQMDDASDEDASSDLSGESTWWSRTRLSWVAHADLQTGDRRIDGLEECTPPYL